MRSGKSDAPQPNEMKLGTEERQYLLLPCTYSIGCTMYSPVFVCPSPPYALLLILEPSRGCLKREREREPIDVCMNPTLHDFFFGCMANTRYIGKCVHNWFWVEWDFVVVYVQTVFFFCQRICILDFNAGSFCDAM